MYNGLAIRLLMKDLISFHAVTLLASACGARIGFLGSSVDEMKPCRRVTLLFDVSSSESDEVRMEQILTRLAPVVSMHKSLLFSEPTIVQTKDRHRECFECGCLAQVHECPFAPGMKPTSGRPNMNGTSASASAVGSLAAGRPPSHVPQADDHMCKSWRQKKTCPRKDKNLPCAFSRILTITYRSRICASSSLVQVTVHAVRCVASSMEPCHHPLQRLIRLLPPLRQRQQQLLSLAHWRPHL
jgi:hypothetical protein